MGKRVSSDKTQTKTLAWNPIFTNYFMLPESRKCTRKCFFKFFFLMSYIAVPESSADLFKWAPLGIDTRPPRVELLSFQLRYSLKKGLFTTSKPKSIHWNVNRDSSTDSRFQGQLSLSSHRILFRKHGLQKKMKKKQLKRQKGKHKHRRLPAPLYSI